MHIIPVVCAGAKSGHHPLLVGISDCYYDFTRDNPMVEREPMRSAMIDQ